MNPVTDGPSDSLFPKMLAVGIDEDLVRQAALGDDRGFEALVRKYTAPLLAFCRQLLRDAVEAEDRVQETFAIAFQKIHLFRPTGKFSSWLFKIAHNKCRDALRARKRWEPLPDQAGEPPPASPDLRLEEAVDRLPAKYQAVLHHKYRLGLNAIEIAEMMDTSPEDVRVCLHRAIKMLRESIGP